MLCIFGGCHRNNDDYPRRMPYGPRELAPGRDRYDRYDRNDRYDRYDRNDRNDRYDRYDRNDRHDWNDDRSCSKCRSRFPRMY